MPRDSTKRPNFLRDGRAPVPNKESTSRVMSANRAKDTKPELELRHEMRCQGLRGYRLHAMGVPGRPDVTFGKAKVAVFVHGCFWHRCPRCRLPLPKTHTEWWRAKFDRNHKRDMAKELALVSAGWRVITIWECEIKEDLTGAGSRVKKQVSRD